MTRRVVLIALSILLMTVGALTAIGGGAVMAVFGTSDTLDSGVQHVSTPTSALTSPVAAIQDASGVQAVLGSIRLRVTAIPAGPGGQIFIGIGPAAAVDRYLSRVGHDEATDVTLAPFRLTLVRHGGTVSAAPPGFQSFWVAEASGTSPAMSWTVTDGSYRLVVMNADGTAPVRFDAQVAITVPHLFAIGASLLAGGIVALVAGLLLLRAVLRSRPRPPGASPGYGMPGGVAFGTKRPEPDSRR